MRNGSFILPPYPPPLDQDNNNHRRNSARSLTTTQSDVPDSLSADDFSNDDSPHSWDDEASSESPESDVKIVQHPLPHSPHSPHSQPHLSQQSVVDSAKPFAFGLMTAHHHHHSQQPQHHQYHPDLSMDVIPKIEELDEDNLQLSDTLHHHHQPPQPSGAPVHVPRKRGRPRKHPLPVAGGQVKITKGRSKTGCITCRRRKKKCDESKPAYALLAPCLPRAPF